MRVAVVAVHYPFGNAEPYLGAELSALAHECERVTVVPMWRKKAMRVVPNGVHVHYFPTFSARCLAGALEMLLTRPRQTCAAIVTLMRSHSRPTTKLKNLTVLPKALAIASWARKNSIDHIHAYWLSTPASAAFIAASIAGIPWSASAHRWDIYEENAVDVKGRFASFIRVISNRGQRDLQARLPENLGDRVRHIPMGVVVPKKLNVSVTTGTILRLLCPAALVQVKGHETLLQALAILRSRGANIHCDFAGTGPLKSLLMRRTADLNLRDVVTFLGHIPQEDLHASFARGDYGAVVLSSNNGENGVMEGVPAALIEAMSHGIPVIATDSGSTGELVDATTGSLVPASNPVALADAIHAVGFNPMRTKARVARAYQRVLFRHELGQQMHALAALINQKSPVPERIRS